MADVISQGHCARAVVKGRERATGVPEGSGSPGGENANLEAEMNGPGGVHSDLHKIICIHRSARCVLIGGGEERAPEARGVPGWGPYNGTGIGGPNTSPRAALADLSAIPCSIAMRAVGSRVASSSSVSRREGASS